MQDFINGLIAIALRPFREVVDAVTGRLSALWNTFTGFAVRVRDRFTGWVARARRWADAQRAHAMSVFTTLRWVILVFVPARISSLAASVVAWTLERVADAARAVRGELAAFRDWSLARLAELRDVLVGLRDWAVNRIAELRSDLAATMRHVFGPLASPEALAAWAVGAIAVALLRLALDMAVPIGRALWASRVQVALEAADQTEDIITRII